MDTALIEAARRGDTGEVGERAHQKIVAMLLGGGADPGLADRDGVTPLAHATTRDHDAIATQLRAHGG